jgi:hypothetical protein
MAGLVLHRQDFRANSAEELAAEIAFRHGPLLRLTEVWQVLGYPSAEAARKALARHRTPIPFVSIEGRRGHFTRAVDLAAWLYKAMALESLECTNTEGAKLKRAVP